MCLNVLNFFSQFMSILIFNWQQLCHFLHFFACGLAFGCPMLWCMPHIGSLAIFFEYIWSMFPLNNARNIYFVIYYIYFVRMHQFEHHSPFPSDYWRTSLISTTISHSNITEIAHTTTNRNAYIGIRSAVQPHIHSQNNEQKKVIQGVSPSQFCYKYLICVLLCL